MSENPPKNTNEKLIEERVHQQLIYKDNRIIDLNNVILDKERQILDLQEQVREQGEVASVKTQAMKIVQQKFEELNRERRDMATETDSGLLSLSIPSTSSGSTRQERRARSSSPGHVIASRKILNGTFSPPPIDPPTEKGSKFGAELPDVDGISHTKKNRKRVTFDLPPAARSGSSEELTSALTEASSENMFLRQKVEELNESVEKMKEQYDAEILKCTKEAKTAGLKARVAATARIKELEGSLESITNRYNTETDRLREEVNTLRNSRDWEIEQNAQLREQVAQLKEKSHKLTEELDDSEQNKRSLDKEVEQTKKLMELMADDLIQAENLITYHENQKEAIFEDIDRLKEAIMAQDRFIEILEADIVIYEQHIGLLRESLGASKIDHRDLIKSKAFETKLLALEREKDLIDKKSNEDRLKTKALDKKCRVLVEQNEQLMAKLCELEMNSSGVEEFRRKVDEMEEEVRQISSALQAERDVGQKLREAKETLERQLELMSSKSEASSSNVAGIDQLEDIQNEATKKIEELTEELHICRGKLEGALCEAEQLRGANFDLQMTVQEANKNVEKFQSTCDDLETQIRDMEERMENQSEELKQAVWDCEQLTKENETMRVEIESSRRGLEEAKRVEKDVVELKEELVRQQELSRKQWEEAVSRMESEEPVEGRKSSMEIQHEQYVIAFEEKIETLKTDLKDAKDELEKEKTEKKKLKQAVKQLRDKLEKKNEVEKENEVVNKVDTTPLQSAVHDSKDEVIALKDSEIEELKKKLNSLEIEAKLSGELNVELGRAMLELEEKNVLLTNKTEKTNEEGEANKMELRLHELLVEEMSSQIEDLQGRIDELSQGRREQMEKLEENLKTELTAAQADADNAKCEMNRLLHNLAEFEIARKDDIDVLKNEHTQEIQQLSIQMEDYRREVSDLERKLQMAEESNLRLEAELKDAKSVAQEQTCAPIMEECRQETVVMQSSSVASLQMPADSDASRSESNPARSKLEDENMRLRECINESSRVHDEVSRDMSKMMELKDELEVAVQALKAEIWSLNGQLKASILDREQLEVKVAELDSLVEKEKNRAISLDVELQEQVDLTEKALRRAAEAENDSNRRLAECLELEERREQVEKAYSSLNEYYNQLQEAYNQVYAQLAVAKQGESVDTEIPTTSAAFDPSQMVKIGSLVEELLALLHIVDKSSLDTKIEAILKNVALLVKQAEETRTALDEQKKINEALRERVETIEQEIGATATTRERIEQLEGEVEWKHEECEGLKRRIKELDSVLETISERADEAEAAKLTTRQADVDSLFRTNAELAHTNVRLQNEIDEWEERSKKDDEQRIEEKENLVKQICELEEKILELEKSIESKENETSSKSEEESEKEMDMKLRIEQLETSEHGLKTHVATLEVEIDDLQRKLADSVKRKEDQESKEEDEEDWGWGSDEPKSDKKEEEEEDLQKQEMERLKNIEKILNNRILALEDQNMELEEKIQEMSEELFEQAEKTKKQDNELLLLRSKPETSTADEGEWGWGEEDEKEVEDSSEKQDKEVERLKSKEIELLERISHLETENKRLKEFLEAAQYALIEEQNRNDELESKFEQQSTSRTNDAHNSESWGWDEETVERESQQNEEAGQLKRTIEVLEKKVCEEEEKNLETQQLLAVEKEKIETMIKQEKELRDRIMELEDILEEMKESEVSTVEVREQLRMSQEKVKELNKELEEKRSMIELLESNLAAKEVKQDENDGGWNDDGWGEDESSNAPISDNSQQTQFFESQLEEKKKEIERMKQKEDDTLTLISQLEDRVTILQSELEENKKKVDEYDEENDELRKKMIECVREKGKLQEQMELISHELEVMKDEKSKLEEKITNDGWNDGWGDEEEEKTENMAEIKNQLEAEIEKRDEMIARLGEELSAVQDELLKANESASNEQMDDVRQELETKNSELEDIRQKLKIVIEQNNLLKDSEARLIDHADEYALQMERYRDECSGMKKIIDEMEKRLNTMSSNSEEALEIKQQMTIMEHDLKNKSRLIEEKEARILELTKEIEKYSKRIIELEEKLKKLEKALLVQRQRRNVPSVSGSANPSRPSSRLSTSSVASHQSQFLPETNAIQSSGSAFDVVVPQSSLEPVRRRNK